MVWKSQARPSQLSDWYSSRGLTGSFHRRVNPLHPEGLCGGDIGLPRPCWWPVSGQIPPCYMFPPERQSSAGAAMWVVGETLHSTSRVVMLRPLLQELDCFGKCRQASSRYREFFEASARQSTRKLHPEVEFDPVNCPIGGSVVLAGPFLRRVNPLNPEGLCGSVIGLPRTSWWPVSGQTPLDTRFLQRLRPPARELCYVVVQECYSIALSPSISPLLGGQDSLLRSWPSGCRPRPL